MAKRKLFVITGFVNSLGRRDTISAPMSLSKARRLKMLHEIQMRGAIPKYRWHEKLKIEGF